MIGEIDNHKTDTKQLPDGSWLVQFAFKLEDWEALKKGLVE